MSASTLLAELRAAGVTLAATGDRLKAEAAPGIITPELTARLKACKPELLAILAGDTEPATDPVALEQCAEFDRIIRDLCAAARFTDDLRDLMLATRRRMSCDAMRAELPIMRGKLLDTEREAATAIRRARVAPGNVSAELDAVRELVKHAEAGDAGLADDRITCRDCANRRSYDGVCKVAEVGGMVNAMRGYVPDATLRRRCAGFTPKPGAVDQRTAAERWPNLGIDEP